MGRGALPSGLEDSAPHRAVRLGIVAEDREFPTRAKLFWLTDRFQLTRYVFGPSGCEPQDARQYGAGALAAVVTLRQHAVIGLSTRASRTNTGTEQRVGMYARLGFGQWGVLTEHEWIDRDLREPLPAATDGVAGLTQVFVAPREWLVLSLGAEYVPIDGTGRYTYRLLPSVQVRVSDKLTFVAGQKDRFTDPDRVHGRSFIVQLYLKTGT